MQTPIMWPQTTFPGFLPIIPLLVTLPTLWSIPSHVCLLSSCPSECPPPSTTSCLPVEGLALPWGFSKITHLPLNPEPCLFTLPIPLWPCFRCFSCADLHPGLLSIWSLISCARLKSPWGQRLSIPLCVALPTPRASPWAWRGRGGGLPMRVRLSVTKGGLGCHAAFPRGSS